MVLKSDQPNFILAKQYLVLSVRLKETLVVAGNHSKYWHPVLQTLEAKVIYSWISRVLRSRKYRPLFFRFLILSSKQNYLCMFHHRTDVVNEMPSAVRGTMVTPVKNLMEKIRVNWILAYSTQYDQRLLSALIDFYWISFKWWRKKTTTWCKGHVLFVKLRRTLRRRKAKRFVFLSFFLHPSGNSCYFFLIFHAGRIFLQECSIICGVSVECPE